MKHRGLAPTVFGVVNGLEWAGFIRPAETAVTAFREGKTYVTVLEPPEGMSMVDMLNIWLFPKKHTACFPYISDEEISEFSGILKEVLSKIYYSLNNPDFNYVIRSLPGRSRHNDFFHWYLSIVPRVTKTAGFEIGSGMYINVALPEQSAKFLREYKL